MIKLKLYNKERIRKLGHLSLDEMTRICDSHSCAENCPLMLRNLDENQSWFCFRACAIEENTNLMGDLGEAASKMREYYQKYKDKEIVITEE